MSTSYISLHVIPQGVGLRWCSKGAWIYHYSRGNQWVWQKLSSGINYTGKTTQALGESEVSRFRNYLLKKYLMFPSGIQWHQGRWPWISGRPPRAGPEELGHTLRSSWLTWVANSFLPHNPLLFKENSFGSIMHRHLARCCTGPLGGYRPQPQGACQMRYRIAAETCWHPPKIVLKHFLHPPSVSNYLCMALGAIPLL